MDLTDIADRSENQMTVECPSDDDTSRLLQLSEEVLQIAATLVNLSMGLGVIPRNDGNRPRPDELEISIRTADWIYKSRRARARYFPEDLFAEPAWDMLLDLLCCESKGRRLSASDLCLGAGVPCTTALRWIAAMVHKGMLIRQPDEHDGRRVFITLAPDTRAALHSYFKEISESK